MAKRSGLISALLLVLSLIFLCETSSAQQTLQVYMSGNLDAGATLTAVPAAGASWAEVGAAATFQQSVEIVDSLFATHTIMIAFFHTAPGMWDFRGYVDSDELQVGGIGVNPAPSIPIQLTNAAATVVFEDSGLLVAGGSFNDVTPTASSISGPPFIPPFTGWANGASASQAVDFEFDFTQFAGPSTPDSIIVTPHPIPPPTTPTPAPTPTLLGETESITVYGNLDARSEIRTVPANPTWVQLNQIADILYTPRVTDSAGLHHYLYIFLVHTEPLVWKVYALAESDSVDTHLLPGGPITLLFNASGQRSTLPVPPLYDTEISHTWPTGATSSIDFTFDITSFAWTSKVDYAAYTAHDPVFPTPTPTPSLTPTPSPTPSPSPTPALAPFSKPHTMDFDADGKDDAVAWRPRTGRWTIRKSSDGSLIETDFGREDDTPLTGDYDGDNLPDLVLWRKSRGLWYICTSARRYDCSKFRTIDFGGRQGTPVASDFDGDGVLELALWLPGGTKYIYKNPLTGATGQIDLGGRKLHPVMGINVE